MRFVVENVVFTEKNILSIQIFQSCINLQKISWITPLSVSQNDVFAKTNWLKGTTDDWQSRLFNKMPYCIPNGIYNTVVGVVYDALIHY